MRELARGWEERLRAAARTSWSRDVRVGTEDGVRFGDVRDALAALDAVRAEAESLRAASDEADEAREADEAERGLLVRRIIAHRGDTLAALPFETLREVARLLGEARRG